MENSRLILPFDYCHRWIRSAFNMAEKHYSLFVVLGLVVFSTEFVASLIPYLGSFLNPVLRFFYTLGGLRLMDHLIQKQPATLELYLKMSFDRDYWPRFQNLILACLGVGLISELGAWARIPHFYLFSAFLNMALLLLPLIAFEMWLSPQLSLEDSSRKVWRQTLKNIGNLVLHSLFVLALGITALALCVAPFFLYFLPLTFPLVYLIYMTLLQQKTIEEIEAQWKS